MIAFKILASALFLFLAVSSNAWSQEGFESVRVADNIYMLRGDGGNIAFMTGDDGVFMIDDKYASDNPAIMAAIAKISDKPVKFLVNTHWHPDHTGGNELLHEAGAVVVAQDNVRKRLSKEQVMEYFKRTVEPLPESALPEITFTDSLTFHFNGGDIDVFHTQPAHTDGDAMVYFKKANVLHAGDVVTVGRYPFIDYNRGGSAEGYIAVLGKLIDMVNDSTRIIPGHGDLCDRQYLRDFQNMFKTVTTHIKAMKDSGSSLEEIIASKPTAEFDSKYEGSVKPDDFVMLVYKSLK